MQRSWYYFKINFLKKLCIPKSIYSSKKCFLRLPEITTKAFYLLKGMIFVNCHCAVGELFFSDSTQLEIRMAGLMPAESMETKAVVPEETGEPHEEMLSAAKRKLSLEMGGQTSSP